MPCIIAKRIGILFLLLIAVTFMIPATICLYITRGFSHIMFLKSLWCAEIEIYYAIEQNARRAVWRNHWAI